MSAREEALQEMTHGHLYLDADRAAELLDAFRAEVLREAAAMIRSIGVEPFEGMNEGARLIREARARAADLIDPDVELDTAP